MTKNDIEQTAEMLWALAKSDSPIDVLALVAKVWIEQRHQWSPWRKFKRAADA